MWNVLKYISVKTPHPYLIRTIPQGRNHKKKFVFVFATSKSTLSGSRDIHVTYTREENLF